MDIAVLKEQAKQGEGVSKKEALFLAEQALEVLRRAADEVRQAVCGNDFDLRSIINGKSGKCPEDCKYCAQSAHCQTNAEFYGLLDEKAVLAEARKNACAGVTIEIDRRMIDVCGFTI